MSKTKEQVEEERKEFVKEIFETGKPNSLEDKFNRAFIAINDLDSALKATWIRGDSSTELVLRDAVNAGDLFTRDVIDFRSALSALLSRINEVIDIANQRALSDLEEQVFLIRK